MVGALLTVACGSRPTTVTPAVPAVTAPSPPAQFIVSGVVHWPKPDDNTVVPGARVDITSGQRTGERYVTDERGAFTLPPIAETDVTLMFSKEDFDDARYAVNGLTASRAIDVELMPQRIRREWNGTICCRTYEDPGADGQDDVLDGWAGPYTFEVHRAGEVSLQLETSCTVAATAFGVLEFRIRLSSHPPDQFADLAAVWAGGLTQTSGSKLRNHYESKPYTLVPGRYLLTAISDGHPNGCLWNLLVVRPY